MSEGHGFSFGDTSVADAYDNGLVPVLFDPWAARLVEEFGPWEGRRVLDLATGTGIVARRIGEQVGSGGKVQGVDINPEMLALAGKRCAGLTPEVEFIESPAHPLEISDDSVDVVVCQQGFQFFPDKGAAAKEIYRVLRDGGRAVATTWRTVEECEFFGVVCGTLDAMGEQEIADMMRVPFNHMPGAELGDHFESAEFTIVQVGEQEQELVMDGGIPHAIEVAHSTPIRPKLAELSDNRQTQFKEALDKRLNEICRDGKTMGRMVTTLVTAEKRS